MKLNIFMVLLILFPNVSLPAPQNEIIVDLNLISEAPIYNYVPEPGDTDIMDLIVPEDEIWEVVSYTREVAVGFYHYGEVDYPALHSAQKTNIENLRTGENLYKEGLGEIVTGVLVALPKDTLRFTTQAYCYVSGPATYFARAKILTFTKVVNKIPVITGFPETNIFIDSVYTFIPSASDQDIGDNLVYKIDNCPSWASFETVTGSLYGTPGWADEGFYNNIQISVIDNHGASASLPEFDLFVINPLEDYGDGRDGVFTGGTINRSRNYYFTEIYMQSGSTMNFYGEGAGIIKVAGDMSVESGAIINLRQDANPEAGIISFVGLERDLNLKELNYGQGGYGQGYDQSRGGQGGAIANGGSGHNFKSNGEGGTQLVFSPPNGDGGEYPGGNGADAPSGYSIYKLNGAWWTNWDYYNAGGGAAGKHGESCENVGFIVKGDVFFQGTINGNGGNGEKGGNGGNGYEKGDGMFKSAAMAGAGGAGGAGGHGGNIYISYRGNANSIDAIKNLSGGFGGAGGSGGYGNAYNEYYSPYTFHSATKADDGTAGGNGDDGDLELIKIPIPQIECISFDTFGEINIGSESTSNLIINNNGDRVLKINSVKIDNAKFSLQLSGIGNYSNWLNPIVIEPNEKADINVKYSPEVEGPDSTVITIVNDDLDNPVIELTIKGIGKGPELLLVPGKINLASSSGIDSVKIKNAGGGELNWKIERNVNWVQFLSDSTGVGEQTVVFSYKKNNGITRKCFLSVTLDDNSESDSLEVIQAPGEHQYHFTPNWTSENPFTPMNVWISDAAIDGIKLSEGDEIGIFDNDKCVGVKAISKTTQYPINIPVGADDPLTSDIDGFSPGHSTNYRIWDYDLSKEITTINSIVSKGKEEFESLSTLVITLEASVQCYPGWTEVIYPNSTTVYGEVRIDGASAKQGDVVGAFIGGECRAVKNVEVDQGRAYVTLLINGDQQGEEVTFKIYSITDCKEYLALGTLQTMPGGTIGNVGNYFSIEYLPDDVQKIHLNNGWNLIALFVHPTKNLPTELFSPLIQTGELIQVKSVNTSYDPNVPPFLNTLTEFKDGLGYWVRVNAETDIQVPGKKLGMLTIDLQEGWNLIGFPRKNSFGVGQIFGGIMQKLHQVKSINKSYDPNVPPFLNTLSNLDPGHGYWVNVDELTRLAFPNNFTIQLAKMSEENRSEPLRWRPVIYPNSTTIYARLSGYVKSGDEVGAFVDDECRGIGRIIESDGILYATLVINGECKEEVRFRLYSDEDEIEIGSSKIIVSKPGEIIETKIEFESAINISEDDIQIPTETKLYTAYPNPFNPTTMIRFELAQESHVEVEIYSITGELVNTIISEDRSAGRYEVAWNGRDEFGSFCSSGVYIVRLKANQFNDFNKIILLK